MKMKWCAGFVPGCSNFSIQYNYACASIATAVMLSQRDVAGDDVVPDFPEPQWAKDLMLGVVFVGSVFGMLTMGYLGDLLGTPRAFVITNGLSVAGALVSALLSWGGPEHVWGVVMAGRFVLGVGVGGNYPLSAARAAASSSTRAEGVASAARAFFWQGPGSCAPYVLALLLLRLPRTAGVTSLQFRILLGAGALPALVVLVASLRESAAPGGQAPASRHERGKLREALRNTRYRKALVGTAGTWFLFDVAFYGTVIFSPSILAHVFGARQSLTSLAGHAVLMSAVGILGTLGGIVALAYLGAKGLNTIGLACAALLFLCFALVFTLQPERHNVLFVLLCLLFFVLYSGPNVATYVLPVVSFPQDVRSTFAGISAAAAKVGAIVGALVFPVVDEVYGVPTVMFMQALICFAGACLSHFCLEDSLGDEEVIGKHQQVGQQGVVIGRAMEAELGLDEPQPAEFDGANGDAQWWQREPERSEKDDIKFID